ncbi:MAG TPA: GFA family protein [Steroidobacteraceae bacterium]|nr:GFA family protein [Steroidobacteraceae bacterium]
MTSAPTANLTLLSANSLTWYQSSERAERGFCRICGGNLFWKPHAEDRIAITAGTLDTPTKLRLIEHIFVADKSDYYEIHDDLPQKPQWM